MGFFSDSEKERRTAVYGNPRCGACGLYKGCRSPKIPLAGEGRKGILVIGEAPGANEDRHGKPFVGEAGQLVQRALKEVGIDFFRDCWVTNTVICRPPDNRDPLPNELECCAPNLMKAIRETKPKVILCLGRFAIAQVVGQLWDTGVGTGTRWVGSQIPSIEWNAWICPTYHPAFITRKEKGDGVEMLLWKRHLKAMSRLRDYPYPDGPPDYGSKVMRLYVPEEAATWIYRWMQEGETLAFDYECDRLKPDHEDARIVSCSVSNGNIAISYPWVGEAIEATARLLWSSVPKVGWNIKFEERWTRRVFGRGVRNWLWDGMQATHVIDNRSDICSLKFQAFVRLGVSSYDTHIAPYLKAESSNAKNNIHKIELADLLFYGGMDSLCTALICKQQMEEVAHEANDG